MVQHMFELTSGLFGSLIYVEAMSNSSLPLSDFSNMVLFQQINEFLRD